MSINTTLHRPGICLACRDRAHTCPRCGADSVRYDMVLVDSYGAGHPRAAVIMECGACLALWHEPTAVPA